MPISKWGSPDDLLRTVAQWRCRGSVFARPSAWRQKWYLRQRIQRMKRRSFRVMRILRSWRTVLVFFLLWGIHLCFFLSIRFFPQNAIRFYVFGIFKYFPCTKIGMSRDISGMFHPSKWNNMMYFFLKVCSIIHPWFDGFGKHVPFFLWKMMYFWYVPSSLKMECLLFSKDLPVVWDPLTWIPNHRAPNKHDFSHIFFIGIYGKITDITIDFWPQHYKVNHRTDDWSMFLITNHIYNIIYMISYNPII